MDEPIEFDVLAPALAEALVPIEPAPGRKAALRARLLERARPAFVTVGPGGDGWQPMGPGVQMKVLHDHGDAQSFMLRMAPGSSVPRHGHASEELCVVLEGNVRLGNIEAGPGTYHLALAGSEHGEISTVTGCLLYLRADLERGIRF